MQLLMLGKANVVAYGFTKGLFETEKMLTHILYMYRY